MRDNPDRPHEAPAPAWRTPGAKRLSPSAEWLIRIVVNVTGAAFAVLFARASLKFFLAAHSLVGGLFVIEQTWFAVAFLSRRPARAVSGRIENWLLAAGGTFGGLLLRPDAPHPPWGVHAGLVLQVAGLAIVIVSLAALGRSFGFLAADRGLKTRGPYAVIRHPLYASYLLIQGGYVLQSFSARNIAIFVLVSACNVGRAMAEERLLAGSPTYRAYQQRVRWHLIPFLW